MVVAETVPLHKFVAKLDTKQLHSDKFTVTLKPYQNRRSTAIHTCGKLFEYHVDLRFCQPQEPEKQMKHDHKKIQESDF